MKTTVQSLAMALACLIMAACSSGADHASSTAGTAPKELKVYSVPATRTDEIHQSLQLALGTDARVSNASPGRLLVFASHDTQASIGQAIAAMEKTTPTTPNDKPGDQALQIRFWVIDALPGDGSDDPALKGLAPALASVRQSMGALHFRLTSSAAAASSLGQKGQIQTNGNQGQDFAFDSKPGRGGSVQLHVGYVDATQSGLTKLQTDLDVQLGHYTVLAQGPGACPAGAITLTNGIPTPPRCDQKPALRLLVVRVDRPASAS